MCENLSSEELKLLVRKVFAPAATDTRVLILVDVPDAAVPDTSAWRDRRRIAAEWLTLFDGISSDLGLEHVELLYYQNVGSNNANLPKTAASWDGPADEVTLKTLHENGTQADLEGRLKDAHIILVMSQLSATAPLKLRAQDYGFKAASMPGFSRTMIPALRLDVDEIQAQVMRIKQRLDAAHAIEIRFMAFERELSLTVDVDGMSGTASSGLLRERGSAANLPSGEAFVVPYEGTLHRPSKTSGKLPVQFGDEVVIYRIEQNRAIQVCTEGPAAEKERRRLRDEPAYGNIAEIGFGVLQRFGIHSVGEVLLDEKLGLHIAFGRSDHFGGTVGPRDFNDPRKIVHIDRVYIPELQDKVSVQEVVFVYPDTRREVVIRHSEYVV